MGQAGRVPKESISILWGEEGEWHVIPNVPCEMVKGAHKEHTRKMRTLGARGTVVRNNGEGSNFLEKDILWESEKGARRLTQFS